MKLMKDELMNYWNYGVGIKCCWNQVFGGGLGIIWIHFQASFMVLD